MTDGDITGFLRNTDLFSALDDQTLQYLSPKLEKIGLIENQVLMKSGDPGDCLYIIKQGKLDILIQNENDQEVLVAVRLAGESVGEIALLTGEKRSAKARSAGSTELLCLSKTSFDALCIEYPPALQQITQAIISRLQQAQLQQLLRASDIFENLGDDVLTDLENELDVTMLKGGDYLVREGDDSDSLHFIISGRLQVVTELINGEQKIWAELGRGQSVGEMGILTNDKRSASVIALRDTLVARLSQDSFYTLLVKHPRTITQQFAGGIVNRLWGQLQGGNRDTNTLATFTIVPANSEVRLDVFCRHLTSVLAEFGSTLHLSSKRIDNLLSKPDAAQTPYDDAYNISLVRWLSEQETKHRYIVYQTDSTPTLWSKRCFRQADRVLIVTPAQADIKPGEVCHQLNRYCKKIDNTLVLLHDTQADSPSNTKSWLNKITPNSHIHIRQHQQQDFKRLARILTGHSVGLVLSGGGARGFAHIGAIRALEEYGLEIDQIAGTSMGAILAAQFAMGWDAQTMLERSRESVKKHYKMEYTLPVVSLLTGKAWGNFLMAFFGDTQIEDLWLNYFCCASNLTDSQLKIYEHGSLWKSVRASSSIPGLVPPIYDEGSIIVDGAVLNNMPVDVMRARNNGGSVYAIDVGGGISNSNQNEFDPVQSGWRLALARKKNKPDIPKMMSILMQSATMGSQMMQQTTRKMADLYITPQVNDYSVLDFESILPIVKDGYQSAQIQIEKWLREQEKTTV